MTDMIGGTNFETKWGAYIFLTYYLFPREIAVSLDQPARVTAGGFQGRTTSSDEELRAHGFDVRVDQSSDGVTTARGLRTLAIRKQVDPAWFSSKRDTLIAFLLPLLTALAGRWLFRFLFPSLASRLPLLEQLACALGLGMLALAGLTLGTKLCGFHGYGLVLVVTALGAGAEAWCHRADYANGLTGGFSNALRAPIAAVLLVTALLVFLILFRLAGLQGLIEFDAVMSWALKAKLLHLFTGSELVRWFSTARLAHAHLDYPTLVPCLHAATYDSLGHVNEFVTKFWPSWMLLFLLAGLRSLNRGGNGWIHGPYFLLLALLLLPATQRYVQWEGATMPMVFFTVLGATQCAVAQLEKDRSRLVLGLTLLFGAAMAKFEGFIFLTLAVGWLLLLPSARSLLKPFKPGWGILGLWLLAALPFLCLRLRIPVLAYESNWAGYALHNPGATLASWPRILFLVLARQWVAPDFAEWSVEAGHLRWAGHWKGLSSLCDPSTLGLPWLCLLLSVALWFACPARRGAALWLFAVVASAVVALSGIFACFSGLLGFAQVLAVYVDSEAAPRYLFPVLVAWAASLATLMFVPKSMAFPGPV
jgi:hypothetical protein